MECPKCHTDASGSGRFCRNCGTPLAQASPSQPTVCPACGADVRPGAKFCGSCAAPLAPGKASAAPQAAATCATCGAELTAGARFCKACGKPVCAAAQDARATPPRVEATPASIPSAVPAPLPPPAVPSAPAQQAARLAASEAPTVMSPLPATPPPSKASVVPKPRVVEELPRPAVSPQVQSQRPQSGGANRTLLLGLIALVVVAAIGAAYWFVVRKPARTETTTAQSPAQPPAVAQPTEAQPSPGQEAQLNPESNTPPPGTDQAPAPATDLTTPAATSAAVQPAHVSKPAAKPSRPAYAQAHDNAQQALMASRYLDPPDGSALFWARKAKALGDPAAAQMEQQVFAKQMADITGSRQSHNYDQARAQIYQLASSFPDHAELRQLQDDVQKEQQAYTQQQAEQRRQAEMAARIRKIAVQHRHGMGNNFCTGIITVDPDGTAKYDCSTADSGGRCEHVTFGPGSLKEVKMRGDGSLHVATRQQGNFDFVGGDMNLKDALDSLKGLVSH